MEQGQNNQCEWDQIRTDGSSDTEQASIVQRRSIVSVQRRVPVETWGAIFAVACSLNTEDGYSLDIRKYKKQHISMFPITLSHVCSRWRTIVTGCHKLWSSIKLEIHQVYVSREVDFARNTTILVETFLRNSAGCLLNLGIKVNTSRVYLGKQSLEVYEKLARQFSRCERLVLDLEDNTLLSTFQGTLHNLSSFHFCPSYPGNKFDEHNPFWEALGQASKLTDVQLAVPRSQNSLPCTQLTTLTFASVGIVHLVDVLQVLESSRNLRSLVFVRFECYVSHPPDLITRCVEMPHLQTLMVGQCNKAENLVEIDSPILDVLLSSLVLPSLSTFRLTGTAGSELESWPSSLFTMLRYASTTLRHMSVMLRPVRCCAGKAFPQLLDATPHLTHLKIGSCGKGYDESGSNFISLLVDDLTYATQNAILPKLESLSLFLHDSKLDSELLNRVLDIAVSRSLSQLSAGDSVQRPLTELRVMYYGWGDFALEPQILEVITDLEGNRMKVIIEEVGWNKIQ